MFGLREFCCIMLCFFFGALMLLCTVFSRLHLRSRLEDMKSDMVSVFCDISATNDTLTVYSFTHSFVRSIIGLTEPSLVI